MECDNSLFLPSWFKGRTATFCHALSISSIPLADKFWKNINFEINLPLKSG